MKYISPFLLSLALMGCPGMGGYNVKDKDGNWVPPNFADGTWSSCTYTNKDGAKRVPPPMQLGGAPLEWTEPDGTGVKCVSIPKAE